jgi:branched-chain amino acid transport system ATP-binding protein
MSLLRIENLNKAFGGLQATHNVSFTVELGEISSIIGPNGAGKTTLFNLLTGRFRSDSGRVVFEGQDITGLAPHKIVQRGVGRSFQRSNIFPRLTAFENVLAAVLSHEGNGRNPWRTLAGMAEHNDRAAFILNSIGLLEKRERLGGVLALGDQKRLEIGLALALKPKLLLLDEPTAGMSPEETRSTVVLIEKLAREFQVTLLFTEHDMAVVFGISQKIRVLHLGAIIATGTPREISQNPDVQRIYLGDEKSGSRFREEKKLIVDSC